MTTIEASSQEDEETTISVVTIAFRNIAGLSDTARSVLAQASADFEWIVVDGGSDDGTVAFLHGVTARRFRFVSEADGGIYEAMNKGIRLARGRYVIFMNAGDTFHSENELARAAKDLAAGDCDLLYGDAIETDGMNDHYKRARGARSVWYSMFTHHQAIYYRRALLAQKGYDESFRLAGDWALTADVLRAGAKAKYVRRAVCRFRREGASQNPKLRVLGEVEARRVYAYHIGLPAPLVVVVAAAKFGVNRLRARFPILYDRLRMRSNQKDVGKMHRNAATGDQR